MIMIAIIMIALVPIVIFGTDTVVRKTLGTN